MRPFCTDHARTCGEPLAGTAALAERHLFLRWPKGKWRRPRLDAVGLDDALRSALKAASGEGRYVGLVDGAVLELISFPDATRVIARDQRHATELVERWHSGAGLHGEKIPRTILCCTDAKTDACCARYGFPLFKALSAAAPAFGIDILQCTHIGGCHLAPSVIVMPDRQRYGRLAPDMVPEFLATVERGHIYLPCYSGNPALTELEQTAEAAVRHHLKASANHTPVTIESIEMHDETRASVALRFGNQKMHVEAQRRTFPIYNNCRNMDDPPKDKQRWVCELIQT
ncbi:sucrase ferredoxin [Martelella mangrovi]|uniref:Sucrase ferredoxin n=1 Tax=Martelella mangrovi TaxID=1397477 RepID=A0ABV2IGM1_9HYPH